MLQVPGFQDFNERTEGESPSVPDAGRTYVSCRRGRGRRVSWVVSPQLVAKTDRINCGRLLKEF
jgi:hypothetical protein